MAVDVYPGLRGITESSVNSTTTPLAASGSFVGTAEDISGFPHVTLTLYAEPSTAKASVFLEFSPDGTNWDISIPVLVENPTLFIPYPLINVGQFFRVRYLNDGGAAAVAIFGGTAGTPTAQTVFRLTTLLHLQPTKELTRTLAQTVTKHQPVILTRSIATAEQPDGDFVNLRESGSDPGNSSTTPLGVSATFTGTAFDTTGFLGVMVYAKSDVVSANNGIKVEFSESSAFTTVHRSVERTFDATDVSDGQGKAFFTPVMLGEFYRVRYVNGGTAQATFLLRTELLTVAAQTPLGGLADTSISGTSLSAMTRSAIVATNGSTFANIGRGTNGGLDIGIIEHEVSTPIKALTTAQVKQVSITTAAARIDTSPLANRKSIEVRALNSNGSARIYLGFSSGVNTGNGREMVANEPITLELDETIEIWAIANTGTQNACVMEVGGTP